MRRARIQMPYYRMPELRYGELKDNCVNEAAFLKRGYVGKDEVGDNVDQKYPKNIAAYLRDFLRSE